MNIKEELEKIKALSAAVNMGTFEYTNKIMVYQELDIDQTKTDIKYTSEEIQKIGDIIYDRYMDFSYETVLDLCSVVAEKMYETKIVPDIKVISKIYDNLYS